MKIAIVTLPLISNFGGILQNYALQVALKGLGHDPITIDYDVSPGRFKYALRCIKSFLLEWNKYKKPNRFLRNHQVVPFISKHMNMTPRIKTYKAPELRNYDAYIVGSDQVWRYRYSKPVIRDVYLRFTNSLKCKRISYAASFGVSSLDYPNSVKKECKRLLQGFDAVSVREESGVKICFDEFEKDATLVVDPTLLNERRVYEQLCEEIQKRDKILVSYVLDMTPEKEELINNTAFKLGLTPVFLTEKREGGVTIEEWLSYFRDADFVFTDSFHGTVFSIIFEKDFISFNNPGRGSDRFTTLLSLFKLEGRILNIFNSIVDWPFVRARKKELAEDGLQFLRTYLK